MSRESEFLLIDISNSYTKIALANGERIGRVRCIPTAQLGVKALHGLRYRRVVLCSVVPEKEKFLLAHFRKQPLIRVSHKIALGVGIDYPKPETIGADRLANAAAAMAVSGGGAPAVVIDFGTAVTFDIISPEKKYIGGVIAPGLEVMTDYLYQRTALLPKITISEPVSAIGKSTRGAMMAGAVIGYRGLVRQILAEIAREMAVSGTKNRSPKKLHVIATGGYAKLIASGLPEIDSVQPNLTLEGLRIIGTLNS